MLAMCIIQFLNRPVGLRDDPYPGAYTTTRTPDALRGVLARGAEWLGADGTVLLGGRTLPRELLDLPADDAIALFDDLLTVGCERLDDEEDVAGLKFALALARATAPLGSRSNYDMEILRSVATRLAHLGRPQLARDLAEHALASAGDDPHRLRLAWAVYAAVHARAGTAIDAMIGAACALVSSADATWEQVWHETILLLRIFRDVGLATFAEPLLARARAALAHLDPSGRRAVRLETMALQLDFAAAAQTGDIEAGDLEQLLTRIADNARGVLAARDELAPVASFLAAALQFASDRDVAAPPGAADLVRDLVEQLSPELGARVELTTLAAPPIDRIVALAPRALGARYAEDIGLDVQYVVALARRLLASDAARDPGVALYAIEATADQAITLPTDEEQGVPAPHLLARREGPLEAAKSLAREGLSVVALGVAGNGLTRVVVTGGEPVLRAPANRGETLPVQLQGHPRSERLLHEHRGDWGERPAGARRHRGQHRLARISAQPAECGRGPRGHDAPARSHAVARVAHGGAPACVPWRRASDGLDPDCSSGSRHFYARHAS